MSNQYHLQYHLLLHTPHGKLSRALRRLNGPRPGSTCVVGRVLPAWKVPIAPAFADRGATSVKL
jgi:hypothetical protein